MKLQTLVLAVVALPLAFSAATTLAGIKHQQNSSLGLFQQQADIGAVQIPGHASYSAKTGIYRVSASGTNMWLGTDAFHFVAKPASGDISIAANIAFEGTSSEPHRKAGVMIRQDLSPDSPYADLVVHGNGLTSLQYRETKGGDTHEIQANITGPGRIRLERQGDYVYMSLAGPDGVLHNAGGVIRLKLTGPFLIGLAVCSHNNAVSETADISKVEIAAMPPPPVSQGYADKVESTLETIDIASTDRRVIYQTTDHIEAPNWSPDGSYFLYNSNGHIFTLPVPAAPQTAAATMPFIPQGTPIQLDTGTLHKINNDHGITRDGQWLAISDQTSDDNNSRVYILPITGGAPRQITAQGPSYWHGWSPDGQTVTVIGNRNGDYDVYSIPSSGGAETRLTTTPGLDDDAEYSPDGQWIYFNSVRSGNMKIWRMHTDGSQQEQVTFGDDTRDWFPHISPDGKWIAFVSFGTDVPVGDHPPDKDTMLRLMPVPGTPDSTEPKVIAKLFGGQGTMNVPSWSPDSKSVAFVSYRIVP